MKVQRQEYIIDRLLKKVEVIDDTIPYINNGGCGKFAKALSDRLDELNIEHTIVGYFGGAEDDSYKEWEKYLSGLPFNVCACVPSHIVIKVGDKYIDSAGIANHKVIVKENCGIPVIEYSKEELQLLIDKGSWNDLFKPRFIPAIHAMLDMAIISIQEELTKEFQTT